MIVVHVIGPNADTPRHEFHFEDGMTDEQILAALRVPDEKGRVPADIIGSVLVRGVDPESGRPALLPLKEGGKTVFVVDHPETVIAVGEIYWEKGKKLFRETRRIQGPPL
jgi:hypothetical protein